MKPLIVPAEAGPPEHIKDFLRRIEVRDLVEPHLGGPEGFTLPQGQREALRHRAVAPIPSISAVNPPEGRLTVTETLIAHATAQTAAPAE